MTRPISFFLACFTILFLGNVDVPFVDSGVSVSDLSISTVAAQSDEKEEREDPRPERKTHAFSSDWFNEHERIMKVWEEEEDLVRVRELLDRMLARSRRWIDAEIASIHYSYARLGFDTDDIDLTVEHLTTMLEYREDLAYSMEENVLWQLAQLYTTRYEEYDTALDYVQQWLDLKLDWEEDGRSYAFIGNIYSRKEDWVKVLHWFERAIAREREDEREIDQNWWRVVLRAHISLADEAQEGTQAERGHLDNALELTKFLIGEYFEEVEYWNTLSVIYARLADSWESMGEEFEEHAERMMDYAGFTIESAYLLGLLTKESEYIRVVASTQRQEAYTRSTWFYQEGFDAEVIERNFENLRRFGEFQQRIRDVDNAVDTFEHAVELDADAKVLYLIARVHRLLDEFDECISYADQALVTTEGELRDPNDVVLLRGICEFMDGQLDVAEETLTSLEANIESETEPDAEPDSVLRNTRSYLKFIKNARGRIEFREKTENDWKEYLEAKAGNDSA